MRRGDNRGERGSLSDSRMGLALSAGRMGWVRMGWVKMTCKATVPKLGGDGHHETPPLHTAF